MSHPPKFPNRYWGTETPPKARSEFFNAVTTPAPSADAGDIATIRMYGPIDSYGGWWGISAEDIGQVLDNLPASVEQIVLRINSPGGEVSEGMAILNMLRAHRATVTAVVDGLAASAASVIASGCDETVMSPGTMMMIHSPSSIVWGNAADMRKVADVLDSFEASLIEIYQGKAGDKDWPALLAAETWLTTAEAQELGLADRVAVIPDAGETSTAGDTMPAEGDDIFEDAATLRPAADRRMAPVASASGSTPNGKETAVAFSDDQLSNMRASLGLPEDADETAILAAVAARPTQAALPEGIVTIDATALEALRTSAQAGVQAREQQLTEKRERLVDDAIKAGKFAASRRDHFIALHELDPEGTATAIANLAENTIPIDELGFDADGETVTAADDEVVSQFAARMGINTGARA